MQLRNRFWTRHTIILEIATAAMLCAAAIGAKATQGTMASSSQRQAVRH